MYVYAKNVQDPLQARAIRLNADSLGRQGVDNGRVVRTNEVLASPGGALVKDGVGIIKIDLSKDEVKAAEIRGAWMEAFTWKGAGFDSPWKTWRNDKGFSKSNVNKEAEGSTNQWCKHPKNSGAC